MVYISLRIRFIRDKLIFTFVFSLKKKSYITAIIKVNNGSIKFVWLYSRKDTLLQNLDKDLLPNKSKELFFTLHCECTKIWPISRIKRKVLVHFGESKCSGK